MESLADGFAAWPLGQDALMDAVECVILAGWDPEQRVCHDADVRELYSVYHRLTGWEPTAEEKLAAAGP